MKRSEDILRSKIFLIEGLLCKATPKSHKARMVSSLSWLNSRVSTEKTVVLTPLVGLSLFSCSFLFSAKLFVALGHAGTCMSFHNVYKNFSERKRPWSPTSIFVDLILTLTFIRVTGTGTHFVSRDFANKE